MKQDAEMFFLFVCPKYYHLQKENIPENVAL